MFYKQHVHTIVVKINYKYLCLTFILFVMWSCSQNNTKIVGTYKMDKFVVRDSSSNISDFSSLTIYENNTFVIKTHDTSGRFNI